MLYININHNDENRNFYVYGYRRLDTNNYFYIGKGTGNRYKEKWSGRNKHFKNIINKVDYKIEIIEENLTEQEAHELEEKLIHDLVYNEGYSIDIKGYNKKSKKHLANCTWGGEGISGYRYTEEQCKKQRRIGKENGMYGKRGKLSPHYGKQYSDEHKTKIKMSNPKRKKVYCIELNRTFNSYREAEKILLKDYKIKCSHASISNLCNGRDKDAGIYIDTGEHAHLHFKIA